MQDSRRPLLFILLIALAVRIPMLLGANGILWPDSLAYYRSAVLMAKFGNFHWHEIYRTPLYPIFLSAFLYLFGQNEFTGFVIVLVQHALGICAICLFYGIGRKALGPAPAFYAALLFSIHTLQLYYETVIQTEILFIFLLFVFIAQGLRFCEVPSVRNAIFLGVVAGLLTLTRPLGQFLIFLVLGIAFIRGSVNRRLVIRSALALCIFFLTLLPWLLVNKLYYNFFGVSQDLGLNLFHRVIDVERIEPRADTAYPKVKEVWERERNKAEISYFYVYHALLRKHIRPLRADRMMAAFALETLRQDPVRYTKNVARTFVAFFLDSRKSVQFCQAERGQYLCTKNSTSISRRTFSNSARGTWLPARRFIFQFFSRMELPIAILSCAAFLGMTVQALRIRSVSPASLLLAGITLYFGALTAIFNIPEDRFRLPADAGIFLFAMSAIGIGIQYAIRKTRSPDSTLEGCESARCG